jgi:hypothetical protein
MSGEVKLKASGDSSELVKALNEANKRVVGLEKQLEKTSAKSQKLSNDEKRTAREARKAYEEMLTPLQRHEKKLVSLRAAVRKGTIGQREYKAAVAKSKMEMDKAGASGKKAFGPGAVAMIGGMATAVAGGLVAAWRLAADEINAVVEAQQRAGEATMPLADAQAMALRNLGATDPVDRERFISDIRGLANDLQVEERKLYLLASDALSARGKLSVEQAMEAVRLGGQVAPEDTETGKAFAGSSLDIAKISGATAEQSAGFLMNVGQMARVTDTGLLAQNVTPALTAATANDATLQTAGSVYAAITGGMADPTGRQSKTATIALSRSLAEFLPEVESMRGRIQALQQDATKREEFLSKYSFEKAAATPIEQLIGGEGATAEAYADFAGRMPGVEASGEFFQQWLETYQGASLQITAAMGMATDKLKESLRTADQSSARIGLVTNELKTTLQDAGMSALSAKLETFGAKIQGNEMDVVLDMLEQERQRLGTSRVEITGRDGAKPVFEERMPTQSDLAKSEALSQFIASIRAASDRERQDIARRQPPRPTPQPGAKLPSRADWISGKISWEEAMN